MSGDKTHIEDLGVFFDALQSDGPTLDADFMASLERQALEEMPASRDSLLDHAIADTDQLPETPQGLFGKILSVFGGWAGAGGLASACALGVVIGLNATTGLSAFSTADSDSYASYGIGMVEEFETAYLSE